MAKTTHQKQLKVKEKDVVLVDNEGTVELSEAELQLLKEQKEKSIKQRKLTQTTSQWNVGEGRDWGSRVR